MVRIHIDTIYYNASVVQLEEMPDLESGGCKFESYQRHQFEEALPVCDAGRPLLVIATLTLSIWIHLWATSPWVTARLLLPNILRFSGVGDPHVCLKNRRTLFDSKGKHHETYGWYRKQYKESRFLLRSASENKEQRFH